MNDYSDSAMVALLPSHSEWCKIELPHLTVVYVGEISDLKDGDFNSLAKDASMVASLAKPMVLDTKGVEVFGQDEKVDVIRFKPSIELLAIRRMFESWNASEFPFRPHATVGPVGSAVYPIPQTIFFNRIMVAWGKDSLVFKLGH